MKDRTPPAIHRYWVVIPDTAIDANGHTNNVEYVRLMQAAAISHADAAGCTTATTAASASWVVRSHHVEYFQPTVAGDQLAVVTWVSTLRKASSLRKYLFLREADRVVVARGETNWVFVDSRTGRPKSIPKDVASLFDVVPEVREPRDWQSLQSYKENQACKFWLLAAASHCCCR